MSELNNNPQGRERWGHQLKYTKIPNLEKEIKKRAGVQKSEVLRLRSYKNDLSNIEYDLQKPITQNSFLNSLKCPTGKPREVKLPKSMRVNK